MCTDMEIQDNTRSVTTQNLVVEYATKLKISCRVMTLGHLVHWIEMSTISWMSLIIQEKVLAILHPLCIYIKDQQLALLYQ